MNRLLTKSRKLPLTLGAMALGVAPLLQAGSPALTGLVAQADNAESAFAAPAGMSRLDGTHITVQTMYITSLADFEVDQDETTISGGDPDKGTDPMIIPSIYYVRQFSDRWHGGLSLTVPSGFGSDYGGTVKLPRIWMASASMSRCRCCMSSPTGPARV